MVRRFPGYPIAAKRAGGRGIAHNPGWVLTETLVGARPVIGGGTRSATRVSRFIGDDRKQWQPQIATLHTVSLGVPWPGIAVELAARGNNVEKVFTVAPGADASRIAIRLRGAERLELASDGVLIAHTGNGPVSFTPPVAWQEIDDAREPVTVAYALAGDRYGFVLGDYDPAYSVVIDPLLQATYLGGSGEDYGTAIALDASGAAFVAGATWSADFPGTIGGAQSIYGGGGQYDAFVAKLSNDLTTVVQATYLGGSREDMANAIALDTSGNVFLAGNTQSADFPGTAGGAQGSNGGGPALSDAFVG